MTKIFLVWNTVGCVGFSLVGLPDYRAIPAAFGEDPGIYRDIVPDESII